MSLLTDLFSTLDKRSLTGIGDALGEPEQTVSRGMQTGIATVLGGLASKSDNHTLLRRMLDLAPSGQASWTSLASGITDPNSAGMTTGKNMLSALFGGSKAASRKRWVVESVCAPASLRLSWRWRRPWS